jgi:hypothetical protein
MQAPARGPAVFLRGSQSAGIGATSWSIFEKFASRFAGGF